jgi:hypothetical protein
MGIIYKNLEDVKVVASVFPNSIVKSDTDNDIDEKYTDRAEHQAGDGILIDGVYHLIPVHSTETHPTLTGEKTVSVISWNVNVFTMYRGTDYFKGGDGEPDVVDEIEMAQMLGFDEAVKPVNEDMFRCYLDGVLENADIDNDSIEDEIEWV